MAACGNEGLAEDVSRLHVEPDLSGHRPMNSAPSSTGLPNQQCLQARDITSEFTEAAASTLPNQENVIVQADPESALRTGQLVKDDYFTLFEAVGALEIMDPKMDTGVLMPGETLDNDYDILKELLPSEVLGIMDQLLCYEMAWHMGNPLMQTLFTSLHIERLLWPDPKTLDQARFDRAVEDQSENPWLHVVLRAYCLGLIKCCDYVHQRISAELYYEEEDFTTNIYNRKLLSDFDDGDIERLLDVAMIWLTQSKSIAIDEDIRKAIACRLELRKQLLQAFAMDLGVIETKNNISWQSAECLLLTYPSTNHLGAKVEDAFSAKVQRRLASSIPPRPVVNISFKEACQYLTKLCQHGTEVARVLEYHGGNHLLNFVWLFNSRKPQPTLYIRCLMQSLIFNEMRVLGSMSIKQLLFDNLEEIVLPADILVDATNSDVEAPQDPRFQIAKKMDSFVTRAGQSYLYMFRILCMNRPRLRRMLCHLIVDWDNLQLDAEELDIEFRPYTKEKPMHDPSVSDEAIWSFPLSSWAYYHKLHQMEWTVQMGFELDIYQPDELAGMYWYLAYLIQTRLLHLQRIRTFTTHRLSPFHSLPNQQSSFARSFSFLDFAALEASATVSFACGMQYLYTHFLSTSLLHAPPLRYTTPSLRYSLRLAPFLALSLPPVPSYVESVATLSPPPDLSPPALKKWQDEILMTADASLKNAKILFEKVMKEKTEVVRIEGCETWWREGVKGVLRSVIVGGIAVAAVEKVGAGTRDESKGHGGKRGKGKEGKGKEWNDFVEVEVGRPYSEWWVVPKVLTR